MTDLEPFLQNINVLTDRVAQISQRLEHALTPGPILIDRIQAHATSNRSLNYT